MKISFVNNQWQLGGAETVVHQLRRGVTELGHAADLYVADGKNYPADVTPLYPRILSRLYHSRFQRAVEAAFPRAKWTDRAFRRLCDNGSDLIHLHNFHGHYATLSSLAHVALNKKLVWTFHRFWGITGGCDHPKDCLRYQAACGNCPELGKWPLGLIDNTAEELRLKLDLIGRLKLNIIAPSEFLAKTVRESKVGKDWNVVYIPNGVDPAEFGFARKHDAEFRRSLGLDADLRAILVVNRNFQDPHKGFSVIKDALAGFDGRKAQILLAGENSDWAAGELKTDARVVALGYVKSRKEMARIYEAADIFLYASPGENFPCVILEAMSAKCCIVSTPTSGVTEQIQHGRTGFLSETISGDSLGRALTDALGNPALGRFGEEARRRVDDEFSERGMVRRHLQLYSEIVAA